LAELTPSQRKFTFVTFNLIRLISAYNLSSSGGAMKTSTTG
jgi:hypothetical protein